MAIDGFTKLTHRRLAEGEATGHHHSAVAEDASLWGGEGGSLVLDAPAGTDVTHQEHRTVALPPGRFDVRQVVEYDHFAEESRAVID